MLADAEQWAVRNPGYSVTIQFFDNERQTDRDGRSLKDKLQLTVRKSRGRTAERSSYLPVVHSVIGPYLPNICLYDELDYLRHRVDDCADGILI